MRKALGVTLIELTIVLALIVTLAGLATVSFMRSYEERNLEHVVKELVIYLRYLQFKAIEEGRVHKLKIDSEASSLVSYVQGEKYNDYEELVTPFARRFKKIDHFLVHLNEGSEIYFFPDGLLTTNELSITAENERGATIEIKNRLGAFQVTVNG